MEKADCTCRARCESHSEAVGGEMENGVRTLEDAICEIGKLFGEPCHRYPFAGMPITEYMIGTTTKFTPLDFSWIRLGGIWQMGKMR